MHYQEKHSLDVTSGATLRRKNMKSNPVHKYGRRYNKARIHIDRKKAAKRGAIKHKGLDYNTDVLC